MDNSVKTTKISPRLRSILALLAITLLALGLGACNTIAGIGEDVSAAGQSLADVAEPNNS